jgi:predicted transcriptional regulator
LLKEVEGHKTQRKATYNKKYWKDKHCYNCNKKGHPSSHCPQKNNKNHDQKSVSSKMSKSSKTSKSSRTSSKAKSINAAQKKLKKSFATLTSRIDELTKEDSDLSISDDEEEASHFQTGTVTAF